MRSVYLNAIFYGQLMIASAYAQVTPEKMEIYNQPDQQEYRLPELEAAARSKNIPVNGTSEYSFNPETGLYEHHSNNVPPSTSITQQQPAENSQKTSNSQLKSGATIYDGKNARGIQNVSPGMETTNPNADAYRAAMGEQENLSGASETIYREDRRSSRRRSSSGDSYYNVYPQDGYYNRGYNNGYNRYGRQNYGYSSRNESQLSPKGSNQDAYQEMMSKIK